MTAVIRTCQRGYHAKGARPAGQVRRVHVIRETGTRSVEPGGQNLCGVQAWNCQDSPPLVREAPHPLPDGLTWCPRCVGLLAEVLGRTAEVAALLGLAGVPR